MGGIFDGSGGQLQVPSGAYSTERNEGKTNVTQYNVVDGPGGIGKDPTIVDGPGGIGKDPTIVDGPGGIGKAATAQEKAGNQGSDPDLTWEQRVLVLLSKLETVKAFKALRPQLRDEVRKLIEDAPKRAYS
jgi:hypothetical protein